MKKSNITLCLIVKNEEKFVSKCIESVLPLVSDIIIGDTGSTDRTMDICRQYTKNIEKIDFSKGFSFARNQLLNKVITEWVLFLDADECFDKIALEKLSQALSKVSNSVDAMSVLRYNFFASGAFYTSETIKIFRSFSEIYYEGIVVDNIKNSLKRRGNKIINLPVILNHFGHSRSLQNRNEKLTKYLLMINKELKNNPGNFVVSGYKALILRVLGEIQEGFLLAKKNLELFPDKAHSHFVIAHILRSMGQHDNSIIEYNKALELDNNNPVYINSRGVAHLTIGEYENAFKDFHLGMNLFPHYVHFQINLALVEESKGKYKKAYDLYKEIADKYPGFLFSESKGIFEVDPYSGYMFDTAYNFKGLSYHLSFCHAKNIGLI